MALDREVRGILDELRVQGVGEFADMTVSRARAAIGAFTALQGDVEPVAEVRHLWVPGPAQPLRARVYRPVADEPLPVIVYFHGGGFVLGDLDLVDKPCRALANATGAIVASVDPRPAPEARFPAAIDDGYAATSWFAEHAAELGGDPTRIGVAGDGTGGTIAAVVAQLARTHACPVLALQLLINPATDLTTEWPSRTENATGCVLSGRDLDWFLGHYLFGDEDVADPRLSPLRGDLADLPPAIVLTAGYDPLRDEGRAYAEALAAAGVQVHDCRNDTLAHGFFWMTGAVEAGRRTLDTVGRLCRRVFTAAVMS